ncbi:MAG: Asp-tRNA(Asn)/Glu-tRNA(Gln) amidotransferase GatCAB subunit B, partial [Gammaproteobacteria bacterium]|nr:Asp-tRNA(Asn)/Glu-tRNA(Gln) amidotransferase GatCAB subunit B [Gammaproteobacteria bacterium]
LPAARQQRFVTDFSLSAYDAEVLTSSREMADYFEEVVSGLDGNAKLAANWVMGELAGALNKENLVISDSRIDASGLAGLLRRIDDNTISGKLAKQVFEAMWAGEGDADAVIDARGLKQITDSGEIASIIDEIIAANPGQVEQYRSGKERLFGFFVGQVMKATQGKANPQQVNELLKKKLA